MKQYNVKAEKRKMSFGELRVIALGERGRGRFETLVACDVHETNFASISKTAAGKPKIILGTDDKGWLARISCQGVYTRGSEGYAYVYADHENKVTVIASGNGADGDAGRIGYWSDYLLQIEDNTLIKVKQHGGYKMPPYYLYFTESKVFKINDQEIDLFIKQHGLNHLAEFKRIEVIHN